MNLYKAILGTSAATLLAACTLIVNALNPNLCEEDRCDGDTFIACQNGVEALPEDCAALGAACDAQAGGCIVAECGNGVAEPGEQCDGADLAGQDCDTATQGAQPDGTLACLVDCTFDTSGCQAAGCGNNTVEAGEVCDDGNNLNGDGCSANCLSDESCGNDFVDVLIGEECDSADLNGESCVTQGFDGGVLACDAACAFDTGACFDLVCGDGVAVAGEQCDDGNTNNNDGCSDQCQAETPGCLGGAPDGNIDSLGGGINEPCDTNDFPGAGANEVNCQDLGFPGGGTLLCSNVCSFDTSQCVP